MFVLSQLMSIKCRMVFTLSHLRESVFNLLVYIFYFLNNIFKIALHTFIVSHNASPVGSHTSEQGNSRSHSPVSEHEDVHTLTRGAHLDENVSGKNSPTPDRESLKIDDMEAMSPQNHISNGEFILKLRCIDV